MLSKWPIRVKFLVSLGLLVLCVAILAGSGLASTHRYRSIVKWLSWRAQEFSPADRVFFVDPFTAMNQEYTPCEYCEPLRGWK